MALTEEVSRMIHLWSRQSKWIINELIDLHVFIWIHFCSVLYLWFINYFAYSMASDIEELQRNISIRCWMLLLLRFLISQSALSNAFQNDPWTRFIGNAWLHFFGLGRTFNVSTRKFHETAPPVGEYVAQEHYWNRHREVLQKMNGSSRETINITV